MEYRYKTQIVPLAGRMESELYLYRLAGSDIYAVSIGNKGELQETKIERGEATQSINAFMVATESVLRGVLTALQDIQKPLGVPEPTKEYANGKLEATEAHLEDMRALVFKKEERYLS